MAAPMRQPCSYEEIDSDALPPGQRVVLWRETKRLPMEPDPADDDGFRQFHINLRRLSGLSGRFGEIRATPMTLRRTNEHCRRDGLDMIGLTLMLEHGIAHRFGTTGRSTMVQPGQILLKDFAQPAVANWTSCVHHGLNLHLPRLTVEAAIGGRRFGHLHGAVLAPDGLAPLLKAQMAALAEIAPRLNAAARAAALEATVALATAVLRVEFGARLEEEENDPGLFAAAQAFINRHAASTRLNPDLIARQLGCSRAHLYRVFAAHGVTVADYLRGLRLRRAHDLLAGDADFGLRIGDIAFRCGFEDPVHFTRLFRRQFGLTPRELKAKRNDARQ